jgi:hypothetical protein
MQSNIEKERGIPAKLDWMIVVIENEHNKKI